MTSKAICILFSESYGASPNELAAERTLAIETVFRRNIKRTEIRNHWRATHGNDSTQVQDTV